MRSSGMSMGRKRPRQSSMFVPSSSARAPGHRFYDKLNELLDGASFDRQVESLCEPFYDSDRTKGRESVPPGVFFRMLLIGYFEGIESERGICWRCEDSLSLRSFLGLELTDSVPDHSTLSKTRKRLGSEVFESVFQIVLRVVEEHGLLRGKVVGVDSTFLRADASMKTIVRRDTGKSYPEYLEQLASEAGDSSPTVESARRMDRKRAKKTSNKDWKSPTDEDARIARLKDGRTRLAYKAEHVTDLETGAILAAEIHPGDSADTATVDASLEAARRNVLDGSNDDDDPDDPPSIEGGDGSEMGSAPSVEVVADKGYYSTRVVTELEKRGFRTYIPEPHRPQKRNLRKLSFEERRAVLENRRRTRRAKGRGHQRKRAELERSFAHICETGAARRTRLRGRDNVQKRYLIQAAAANLGLVLRNLLGSGTPRGFAARRAISALLRVWCSVANLRSEFVREPPRRLTAAITPASVMLRGV